MDVKEIEEKQMNIFRIYLVLCLWMFASVGVGMFLGLVEPISIVKLFMLSLLWPFFMLYGIILGFLLGIGMLEAFVGII